MLWYEYLIALLFENNDDEYHIEDDIEYYIDMCGNVIEIEI